MANAICYNRKKRGMTQKKLAELVGLDRPLLSKLENPKIPIDPDEDLAIKIARVLGVLVIDIINPR